MSAGSEVIARHPRGYEREQMIMPEAAQRTPFLLETMWRVRSIQQRLYHRIGRG
jgi:hypothetical protein